MIETQTIEAPVSDATVSEAQRPRHRPSLESLAKSICDDARSENLRYLIRSNTSHDGE